MCQPSEKEEAERIHEARVRIAQRLLDDIERARREESQLGNAIGEAIGQAKFGS